MKKVKHGVVIGPHFFEPQAVRERERERERERGQFVDMPRSLA